MLNLIVAAIIAAFGVGFAGGFATEYHWAGVNALKSQVASLERINGLYAQAAGVAEKLDADSASAGAANEQIVRDILTGLRDKAAQADKPAAQAAQADKPAAQAVAFLSPNVAVVTPEVGASDGIAKLPSSDGVPVPKPQANKRPGKVRQLWTTVTKRAKPKPAQTVWNTDVCVDADSMRRLRSLK